jgi:parallel beta-helix repeat protein
VTIKNGVVRDFSRGVTSYFASHNEIRGLYISGGFAGVSDVGGRNHIERNTISNVDTAIGLFSNDNFVAHNTLSHNERGVNIDGGSGNEIRHNQLFDNGFGIFITDSPAANRVAENAVSASLEGIRLNEASRGHVEHNLVQANTIGIHLASSYFVQIVGNRALENQDGILVAGELDGEGNVLARNRTSRNADDGIEVDHPGITVVRNVADHNGDLGIEAVAGVIDGGKNRAFGNGNPLQCLNVSCK